MALLDAVFADQPGMTPQDVARRRKLAEQLLSEAGDASPVAHPLQALARVLQAGSGKLQESRANRAEKEGLAQRQNALTGWLGGMPGNTQTATAPMRMGAASQLPDTSRAGSTIDFANAGAPAGPSALPQSFLSAVDSKEGAGSYDTLYGHAQNNAFAGTRVSAMPISEVMAFSDPNGKYAQHVKGQIGRVATPMGRHQIVGATLRRAVADLGLDPSQLFDANTQDTIAAHLARNRLAGAGSTAGKIAALRAEWHGFNSVPDSQMAQIVADLESSGGAAPEAPAPVQVASLDPNAGLAQALGSAPQPSPVAMPANPVSAIAQTPSPAVPQQNMQLAQALTGGQAPQPSMDMQRIGQMLSNPWTEDVGNMALQQYLGQQEAAREQQQWMQRQQYEQQQGAAVRQEGYAREDARNTVEDNRADRDYELRYFTANRPPAQVQEYEYYAQSERDAGREPLGPMEYEQGLRKSGAATTTVNTGEGDKFYTKLDEKNAEAFSAMSDAGVQGRSKLAQIERLQGILDTAPQGMGAGFKQMLGEYGIPTEGIDELQAAQALINELVPQQRLPGSGPMSDADLALFKQSLPRIVNQPGGNQMILDTMRGITNYQIQMGDIADQVADRTMTAAEGRKAIRALENPLANIKNISEPEVGMPESAPVVGETDGGYRFKGGDPADPNNWEAIR